MNAPKFCLIPSLVVLLLAGCEPKPFVTGGAVGERACVDNNKTRVDDYRCVGATTYSGVHPFGAYYWWYMPRGGYLPPVGNLVNTSGGSYYRSAVASTGGEVASSNGVARGGFGSTAHSFGGSAAS